MLLSIESSAMTFESIIQTLKTTSKYRTTKSLLIVFNQLYNYKQLLDYINASSKEKEKEVLIELASILSHKSFKIKEVIKSINNNDTFFYIIMKGKIAELSLKYCEYFLTEEEYIIHLIKLKLLNETEILSQSINLNKRIFPIKGNVITWIYSYNESIAVEYISRATKSIKEIEMMNKGKDVNYYINLTNQSASKAKNRIEKKTQYHFTLPSYYFAKTLKEGNYIGTLSLNKRYKSYSTFIAIEECEVGVLDKENFKNSHLFSAYDNIIKKDFGDILNGYFIFNHLGNEHILNILPPLFTYKLVKKGDMIYKQNSFFEGLYFIKAGEFKVTANKRYDELNGLILDLKHSLDIHEDYQADIKNNIFEDFSNEDNNQFNPFLFSNEFLSHRRIVKEITIANINKRQVIGLSEFYNKYHIMYFNVECISKTAEVYFLPKESFFSIINKDIMIKFNSCRLTEKNVKFFIEEIRMYKKRYVSNLENNIKNERKNKNTNYSINFKSIHSNSSLLIKPKSTKIPKLTNSSNSFESKPSHILKKSHLEQKSINYTKIINTKTKSNFTKTLFKKLSNSTKTLKPTVFSTLFPKIKQKKINLFIQKKK